jgi:hypothetical protein
VKASGPQRVEREIARLDEEELSSYALRRAAMERLGEAVPVDGWCFATADPHTLVMTSHATSGVDRSTSPLLYVNEYAQRDVSKHDELARAEWPLRLLSQATGGELTRSPRYRGLLRPAGIEHELRGAVRTGGATWGFLHLFRRSDRRDFSADEVAIVERFLRAVAPVLRDALVGERIAPAPAPGPPALILLDERNRLVEGTVGGHGWAAALPDAELEAEAVPEVFVTLAIWARSLASRGSRPPPGPASRATEGPGTRRARCARTATAWRSSCSRPSPPSSCRSCSATSVSRRRNVR